MVSNHYLCSYCTSMIRTTFVPNNTNLLISIPPYYVGKQAEVLVYTMEEIEQQKTLITSVSELLGKLNLYRNQYNDFQNFTQTGRS